MSIVIKCAPGVEMTLLSSSLIVSRLAVGVPQSMGTSKFWPPKVRRVLFTSSFWGRTLHTIPECATSFHLSLGISSLFMNVKVSVPSLLPGIPCARRPISFPKEKPQSFLYFGRCIKCLYSSNSPVSSSMTAAAKSARNYKGKVRDAACLADGQLSDTSTAESRAWIFDLVFCDGDSPCDIRFGDDPSFVVE